MPSDVLEALVGRILVRGVVAREDAAGVWVEVEGEGAIPCDALRGALVEEEPARPGERVLVALTSEAPRRGCVVGVIEPRGAGGPGVEVPDRRIRARRIVVEAGERIELRVAGAAVILTEKGEILIQGRNVLSRARALNRIRGAAVRIN
jgi:hypothetical protein